jgi:hypothetical protein
MNDRYCRKQLTRKAIERLLAAPVTAYARGGARDDYSNLAAERPPAAGSNTA